MCSNPNSYAIVLCMGKSGLPILEIELRSKVNDFSCTLYKNWAWGACRKCP